MYSGVVSDRTYRGYKLKVAIRYYSKGTGVEVRTTPVSGVVTEFFVFFTAVKE
jgi:ribosomal protein L19